MINQNGEKQIWKLFVRNYSWKCFVIPKIDAIIIGVLYTWAVLVFLVTLAVTHTQSNRFHKIKNKISGANFWLQFSETFNLILCITFLKISLYPLSFTLVKWPFLTIGVFDIMIIFVIPKYSETRNIIMSETILHHDHSITDKTGQSLNKSNLTISHRD